MFSSSEIIIIVIVLMGFPLIISETKKHKGMLLAFLGYLALLFSAITALFMVPGSTGLVALVRSVFIMSAGVFFGASAIISYRRMKEVIQ